MINKPEISSPIKSKIPSKQANYISPVYENYCQEAKSLFQNLTDLSRKKIQNDFIKGCKEDDNWDKFDAIWILAASNKADAKVNWKNPGLYSISEVGSPTFAIDQGFSGSTGNYLNTNYNPILNGVNFTQNNASIGLYSRTDNDNTNISCGQYNGTNGIELRLKLSGAFSARFNSNLFPAVGGISNSLGLFYAYRIDASNINFGKNGTLLSTQSAPSFAPLNLNIFLLSLNSSGSPLTYDTRQFSCMWIGSGNIDFMALYNRIQTYLTAISANV